MPRRASKSKKPKEKRVSNGKPKPRTSSRKRIYTFRDLAIPPQSTFEEYLLYLSEHPEIADKYLRPGEKWAIEIYGNKTFVPFDTAALFGPNGYLDRYEGLMNWARDPHKVDELIRNIRIVKAGHPNQEEEVMEEEYHTQREREKQEAEEITRQAERVFATKEKREGRKPSKQSLLKSALDKVGELSKQVADLQKKFAAIEKQGKKRKPKKAAPKKAAPKKAKPKKAAPKKVAPKKAAPKKAAPKKAALKKAKKTTQKRKGRK